jgi:hypothetical protein
LSILRYYTTSKDLSSALLVHTGPVLDMSDLATNAAVGRVGSRHSLLGPNAVTCRAYAYHMVARAKRVDTALSFCWFHRFVDQVENVVYGPSGTRLGLFARHSPNSQLSTSVVDELARSGWSGSLFHSLFIPRAVEEVILRSIPKDGASPE